MAQKLRHKWLQKIKNHYHQHLQQIEHHQLWLNALKGMAVGFFATLVISAFLLITTINLPASAFRPDSPYLLVQIQNYLKFVTPFAIGISIGYFVKLNIYQIIGCGIVGLIAAHSTFVAWFDVSKKMIVFNQTRIGLNIFTPQSGDVFAALLSVVLTIYCFKLLALNKFYFAMVFSPLLAILLGFISSLSVSFITSLIFALLKYLIAISITENYWWSILFSPLLGVIIGIALPLPISAAALALSLNLTGISGLIGLTGATSVTLVFALMTYLGTHDWRKTCIIFLGTPMLLMANYFKNHKMLWVPIGIGLIIPLISTVIFGLFTIKTQAIYVGLGFSPLFIPQILFLLDNVWWMALLHILFMQMILPFILAYLPLKMMFKQKWLTNQDFIF